MKKIKVLVTTLAVVFLLSSFGVVENNKYVKAKVEQQAITVTKFNKSVVMNDLIVIQPKYVEETKKQDVSFAQKLGNVVVEFVKNAFVVALNFLVNLIK